MPNTISGDDYLEIATYLGLAWQQMKTAGDYLYDATYSIVLLQTLMPEVDLLNEFYNSYKANIEITQAPQNFLSAVRALQSHVMTRGGYTTEQGIDAYLDANAITVPYYFAELSEAAGFAISDANTDAQP